MTKYQFSDLVMMISLFRVDRWYSCVFTYILACVYVLYIFSTQTQTTFIKTIIYRPWRYQIWPWTLYVYLVWYGLVCMYIYERNRRVCSLSWLKDILIFLNFCIYCMHFWTTTTTATIIIVIISHYNLSCEYKLAEENTHRIYWNNIHHPTIPSSSYS